MGNDKDIIKELRHAEKLGLFESQSQMMGHTFSDMQNNKEVDDFHSTGFLTQNPAYFDENNLNIDIIFSSIPLPMVFKNPRGVYLIVNDLFCDFIGKKKDKIIGKTDFDLFVEDQAKNFFDADERVLTNGKNESQIEKITEPDEKWVRVTRNPVVNQGNIVGLICSFMDVTSEQSVTASEKKFKLIFENAPDGMYINDGEGRFVDGNKQAEKIIGYQRQELIGKKFSDVALLKKRDIPKALKNLAMNKLGKATGPTEFELIKKDGSTVNLEISNFPFKIDGKQMALGIARDITLRKKVEQIAKDRQIEIEQIFEAIPEALVYVDKDRKISRVNSGFEKIFGYKREEVIGKKTKILYANLKEYDEQGEKRFNANARNKFEQFEINYRRKKGEIFPSEAVGTPVRDVQGKVIGFLGLIRDITERKKVDDKLKSSEKKLKLAMNAAHEGVWEWNLKTNEVFFDDVALAMVDYNPGDFKGDLKKGSWWMDQVHPDDKEGMNSTFRQFISGEIDSYDVEFRLKRKNGGFTWVLSSGIISKYDDTGKAEIVIGIHQDITERKQEEQEHKKSENRLRLAMDAGEHGFWDWNLDTDDIYFSPRYYTMLGYESGELPMKKETWTDLMHPDDRKRIVPLVEKYVKKAQPYEVEFRLRCKDGSYKLIKGKGNMYDTDEKGVAHRAVGTHEDITEKKKTEDELKEKFEELQRWKKLTVGRELKMSMLKEKIRRLEEERTKK